MSLLLIACGIVIAFVLALVRALALDEVRGRIQRRAENSVEATIASLPRDLREEWGDEWRGELAAMKTMPLSAVAFARGLRRTAFELTETSELAPARAGFIQRGWASRSRIEQMASRVSSSRFFGFLKELWRPFSSKAIGVSVAVTLFTGVATALFQLLLMLGETAMAVLIAAGGAVAGFLWGIWRR